MATSVLTIAGSTVVRSTSKIVLDRWDNNYDGPSELAFTELCANLPGTFAPESAVTLTIGGTLSFSGNIYSRAPTGVATGSISIGYRCLDLRFRANMVPVTASDGTGTMTFNIPSSNIGNYQPNFAGLSVGGILTIVFAQHSAALAALGITTDATTTSQLATLSVVPPDPVYFQGNRLWSQVDQLLQQWYGSRMVSYIMPGGQIRVIDTTALTPQTLTFGTDPIILDSIQEDTSECFTSVLVRGRSNVDGAYLSLGEATLVDPHAASGDNAEATWTMADFLTPKGASSTGTVSSNTSTTITVTSDNALETWPANYWSGLQAQITAINVLSTAVTGMETHRITANTALTAGGTSILTVDVPFASTGFGRYSIRGNNTSKSEAYRRLNIKNTYIAQHLQSQFNFAMKWSPSIGAVTQVWYPVGVVDGVSAGIPFEFPAQFEVIPYDGTTNGYIRFFQPWVSYFNSQANLNAGGGAVVQATNIKVLLPFSRGTMTTSYPASGYAGTAFSRFNVQRVLTRDYQSWWDQGSTTAMTTLAQQVHATVSNAVIEGQLTYFGQNLTALTPGAPIALNLANWTGTISYESMAAPVRSCSLEWPKGGAAQWITRHKFSTRRQQYSGDRLYVHPAFLSGGFLSGSATLAAGVSGMPQGNVLVQAFENANMAVGPEFNPVFNPGEIAAFNRASGAESQALTEMRNSERDTRPDDALQRIQGAEANAANQVFFPGEIN